MEVSRALATVDVGFHYLPSLLIIQGPLGLQEQIAHMTHMTHSQRSSRSHVESPL